MGLFDLLTAGKTAPSQAEPGLMSKLNYGGMPMGVRLMAAIEALQAINNPDMNRPAMINFARMGEKARDDRKAQEELAKKQEKANRLADKLELSNPTLAAALRENPELVDEYGKNVISDTFETKRYDRTRADQIEDRNFDANLTREGWTVADKRQEDAQAHDLSMEETKARLDEEAKIAAANRDAALRAGRVKDAQMIVDGFLNETGVDIGMPTESAPGPSAVPAPIPGTLDGTAPPRQAPGLLNPQQPMPEEGDTAPAPPKEVQAWTTYFKDPSLTPSEVAQLSATFKKTLSESMQNGKDPDANLALGAAAETYRLILKNRNETTTAEAAKSEAETKANAADRKTRIEASEAANKAMVGAKSRSQTGDNVVDAITSIETAMDPKNEDWLPATGMGSWATSMVGDTEYTGNARAIWNAVNTVKANLGFDALQAMRDASPTGGALGQVAVQELEMLQSTVASLDQTDANFAKNLQKIKELYASVKETSANYAEDIKNLRAQPTEEHIAEFQEMYGVDSHLKFLGE